MSDTQIEWCDKVWNVVTGCTPCSPGCTHCYAKRMASRLAGRFGYPADEPFRVTLHEDRLDEPLKWKKSSRIFVVSMGDLFHEDVPTSYILRVFSTMAVSRQHAFMVLTKRPKRMLHLFKYEEILRCDSAEHHQLLTMMPLPNVYLGVTCENQAHADERIPILLQVPAAVRFVSAEPLLGPISFWPWLSSPSVAAMYSRELPLLDLVIAGGETGPNARPMDPAWARSIRDQCKAAGVPFFFKKAGGNQPTPDDLMIREFPEVPNARR